MPNQKQTGGFCCDVQTGLTADQILLMRRRFGRNELTPPARKSWWVELLEKFNDPTIRILIAAAGISLAVTAVEKYGLGNAEANFIDSIGIFFAVALATLVGFLSERKSAKEFELLNRVKEEIAVKALRGGQLGSVPISELVVGDLIRIDPGDKIPADGVLVEAVNLYVDQAMMTGESVPAKKSAFVGPLLIENLIKSVRPQSEKFVARGTMVADGRGLFVVTAVGDRTQMGQIATSLTAEDESKSETPLVLKLTRLAKQISVVGIVGASAIFSVMATVATIHSPLLRELVRRPWMAILATMFSVLFGAILTRAALLPFFSSMEMPIRSRRLAFAASLPMVIAAFSILLGLTGLSDHLDAAVFLLKNILLAFVVAVTVIVVAVPEGLPMMVTISLALNMMKMARQNCLVRRLVASETIGAATVICTDKTGTLTENRMTPVSIFADGRLWRREDFDSLGTSAVWRSIERGIAINSQANLHIETVDKREKVTGVGNPTECALLKFLHEHSIDYRRVRAESERIFELAHNSDRKMSVAAVRADSEEICYVKGAPERVMACCDKVRLGERDEPLAEHRLEVERFIASASSDALRIIAMSEKSSESFCGACRGESADCLSCTGRTLTALIGIADPVRAEVPNAVRTCREAHIQVKMITGDALLTAAAIARSAGIVSDDPSELILTSEQFAEISDDELPEAAERIRILARSTPMDKLRLVKALHRKGEVVAMTGDGTNDAPALKYADVGLAMGVTGTEVAKEAGDIVLVDDNFKSIVTGVWWGRTLFQNIRRFLQFQLSVNAVALFCALFGPMVGVPLPLTVTQLLWINIIMDTFAALALSTDPPRRHTMTERPIPRNASIITRSMGVSILTVSLYQAVFLFAGLFFGWFVDAEHFYDFSISATTPEYLAHNLQALTIFFTTLVMFQFWHKFNCRALRHNESPFDLIGKNRLFLFIVATITIVQILMVQSHAVGQFFRTVPLSLAQWLEITLWTATVLPVSWLGRQAAHWLFPNDEL